MTITPPRPSIMSPQHRPIQDLAKGHLIPIVNAIIGETDMVGEDDDYNVDEGRSLDNLSRENLERRISNDDWDGGINPGQAQEMLDQ
ncbi:3818_t:CDS:2, partial [Ambispora leptoticha]